MELFANWRHSFFLYLFTKQSVSFMTIRNIRQQSPEFSVLGSDIGVKIFEKVMQSGEKASRQSGLPLTFELNSAFHEYL